MIGPMQATGGWRETENINSLSLILKWGDIDNYSPINTHIIYIYIYIYIYKSNGHFY
jgi:hypothetical protein